MGRGDRKTKKGKIAIRSYGNSRPHGVTAVGVAKVTKPAAKKAAPVKKTAAKKSA